MAGCLKNRSVLQCVCFSASQQRATTDFYFETSGRKGGASGKFIFLHSQIIIYLRETTSSKLSFSYNNYCFSYNGKQVLKSDDALWYDFAILPSHFHGLTKNHFSGEVIISLYSHFTHPTMLFKTLNSALVLGTTLAAPSAWNGIWNDPVYGGQIKVCVSEVSSVWYGQATISDTAYMRGTIDATTDVWTGNFYVQGIEAQRGTFSLTMTTGEWLAACLMPFIWFIHYFLHAFESFISFIHAFIHAFIHVSPNEGHLVISSALTSHHRIIHLKQSAGTPNTYAASWTQLPGIFTYTSAGSQSDTNEPSGVDCFKTDDDYVSLAEAHSFTGTLGFG